MDKSRVEPTIFFIEKISFSLKLFSGHFYGQSFIKTVRGPSIMQEHESVSIYFSYDIKIVLKSYFWRESVRVLPYA